MELNPATVIAFLVVTVAVVIAAITDLRNFRVYNALTFPLVFSGLAFHSLTPWGLGAEFGFSGAAIGFALLFVPFLLGGIGAGDLKLLTGIGAWCGPALLLINFSVLGIATGLYSTVIMIRQRRLAAGIQTLFLPFFHLGNLSLYIAAEDRVEDVVQQPERRKRLMPLAAIMCLSTLVTLGVHVYHAWN